MDKASIVFPASAKIVGNAFRTDYRDLIAPLVILRRQDATVSPYPLFIAEWRNPSRSFSSNDRMPP